MSEDVVLEHKKYMETIRELTDWLMVVGEELQQHSDPSGDPPVLNQKLTKVRVRVLNLKILKNWSVLSYIFL